MTHTTTPATPAPSRAAEFREQLSKRVLVADGAMGTMLYAKGVFINRCYDELNLSAPAMVREIHEEYVKAGAEILETNTFGANRIRLAAFGFAEKLTAINQAGVRLAREAAGRPGFRRRHHRPARRPHRAARPDLLRRSPRRLPRAGRSAGRSRRRPAGPRNLRRPRRTARGHLRRARSRRPDMVIVAQVTIDDFGNMPDGTDTATFTRKLDEWPADVDRPELLGRPQGDARDHRADGAAHAQADERDAQRRPPGHGRGPQDLSCARPSTWRSTRGASSGPASRSSADAAAPRRSTSS